MLRTVKYLALASTMLWKARKSVGLQVKGYRGLIGGMASKVLAYITFKTAIIIKMLYKPTRLSEEVFFSVVLRFQLQLSLFKFKYNKVAQLFSLSTQKRVMCVYNEASTQRQTQRLDRKSLGGRQISCDTHSIQRKLNSCVLANKFKRNKHRKMGFNRYLHTVSLRSVNIQITRRVKS